MPETECVLLSISNFKETENRDDPSKTEPLPTNDVFSYLKEEARTYLQQYSTTL